MIGATLTPTGTPASLNALTIARRRCGAAARGSSLRASSRSSIAIETNTRTSPLAAIGARRSRSRSISAPLVVIVIGCSHSASISISERVIFHSRSIGWYGSVLAPSAIGSQR